MCFPCSVCCMNVAESMLIPSFCTMLCHVWFACSSRLGCLVWRLLLFGAQRVANSHRLLVSYYLPFSLPLSYRGVLLRSLLFTSRFG